MTALVELTNVSKRYNGEAAQAALDGVNLSFKSGEFAAVMGPSGSGKSTLLNLIAGLDRPSQGRVTVQGTDLSTLDEAELARFRRSQVGFIFQFFNLLNNLTVMENVLIPAQLAGVKPQVAVRRATELTEQLGLSSVAKHFPGRLSGGERQRVAIARALINRPILLLADEPTGALDSQNGEQVMQQLVELNQHGQTILLVTHDPKLAAAHASRVISLRDGAVTDDVKLQAPPHVTTREVVRLKLEDAAQ